MQGTGQGDHFGVSDLEWLPWLDVSIQFPFRTHTHTYTHTHLVCHGSPQLVSETRGHSGATVSDGQHNSPPRFVPAKGDLHAAPTGNALQGPVQQVPRRAVQCVPRHGCGCNHWKPSGFKAFHGDVHFVGWNRVPRNSRAFQDVHGNPKMPIWVQDCTSRTDGVVSPKCNYGHGNASQFGREHTNFGGFQRFPVQFTPLKRFSYV